MASRRAPFGYIYEVGTDAFVRPATQDDVLRSRAGEQSFEEEGRVVYYAPGVKGQDVIQFITSPEVRSVRH